MIAVSIVSMFLSATGSDGGPSTPLAPIHLMDAGYDCQFVYGEISMLEFADVYGEHSLIAPPRPDQDRDAWLAALTEYRETLRQGTLLDAVLRFSYNGVRSWARFDWETAKAFNARPGDEVTVQLEARWISGNPEICFAFDIHDADTDEKTDWTGVLATREVPQDGAWHWVEANARVPEFDPSQEWLRPIIGFDATQDATPGRIEVRAITLSVPDPERQEAFNAYVETKTTPEPMDFSAYERSDLQWLPQTFAIHFTFLYDRSIYNPETQTFTVDQFLDDGERQFGGYDGVLLWHAYPRIGLDDRNQFDFYRDMPGGLEGLRDLVHQFHDRGVKVFINYNPWDKGTRREGMTDEEALAEMVDGLDVDGIFLDTMFASSPGLRQLVDERRSGVAFVPEGHPRVKELPELVGSWAQWGAPSFSPVMLHHKWIERRHIQYQIRRWNESHMDEIEAAFFNGSGMKIWENIFGYHNPWNPEDRATWRRAVGVLRAFPDHFLSEAWEPFYPTAAPSLYAHRWQEESTNSTIFTFINEGDPIENGSLVTVPWSAEMKCYDLWNGTSIEVRREGNDAVLLGSVERLGGVLVVRDHEPPQLDELLERQRLEAQLTLAEVDIRGVSRSVMYAEPVLRTPAWTEAEPPEGMVYVPQETIALELEHVRRECGCYPDPGTPESDYGQFLQGWDWAHQMEHTVGPVYAGPFYIDETEVTNAQFKEFLEATGYRPDQPENFLKHWSNGVMPPELAEHPVVYVDINDARAYAEWAGKRLPTEEEWHLAAQGTDGRTWPWGMEFDESRVNTSGETMPVRSLPEGRSPYGCYHISGNVYEFTESVRDDGHTRFLMLRGGSFYDPNDPPETQSVWYMDGGARPITHHAKMILMWPGLDRTATIGFRCVVDATR